MKRNTRTLDAIASDIYRVEKRSVIEIGELLLEARPLCEHGQWIDWLEANGWSTSGADRYMKVAELAAQFSQLGNLRLSKSTLYELIECDEKALPAIIAELAKHESRLTPHDARGVIEIVIARRRFGNHPDATLRKLTIVSDGGALWRPKAVAALKKQQPTTDEAADAIVDGFQQEYEATVRAALQAAAAEADAILNGESPTLPPPSPSQDQRLPYKPKESWGDEEEEEDEEKDKSKPKRDTSISFDKIVATVGEIIKTEASYDADRLLSFFTALFDKANLGLALPRVDEAASKKEGGQ
jgi:hypothetical protein